MGLQFELERMERLISDIKELRYPIRIPVIRYRMQNGKAEGGACCDTESWTEIDIGTPWSELDDHRWYRTTIVIPEEMDKKRVEFVITTGREGEWDATNPQMLFFLNGEIVQGVDVNHREVTITACAAAGDSYDIAILAYSGSVEEDLIIRTELAVLDEQVDQFYYDFLIPLQSARLLHGHDEDNCRRILTGLAPAADLLDLRKPYSQRFYESIARAGRIIAGEFYGVVDERAPVVSAVGHTHIDVAWLWTVEQTKEKVIRSFATVLRLMDQYPDYKFMSSQPILYQFVKDQEPEMYEQIRERIAEGRWEADGAMWLEADCNLTGGESLVRQLIKGQRFFREEFGIQSKSLWLPDVFGYSAALPQILKRSGIPYFSTTKIAWNQYNQLPNDTFMWRGIDGSEVFVIMPTTCDFSKELGLNISFTDTRNTTTYTGIVNPNMTLGTYKRFQNRDLTENTLMLFGFGDGGGGPTREMLENAKRLSYGIPGIPRLVMEFEQDYFDRTYETIAKLPQMPVWNGELYFEYHRGTLTSRGKSKRSNRKNEILYEQLETMAAMTMHGGIPYPAETIRRGWDILLLNQFHDILPGTSIPQVYEQADREYEEIHRAGWQALNDIAKAAAAKLTTGSQAIVVFNTQGYERDDMVNLEIPQGIRIQSIMEEDGTECPLQYGEDGRLLFWADRIPPLGYKIFYYTLGEDSREVVLPSWEGVYENQWYRARFDERMELVSLYEKEAEKELIKEGEKGNQLAAFEDRPMNWDNWDIDIFYQKKKYEPDWVSPTEVVEHGPVRTTLKTSYGFEDSVVTQKVHLYRHCGRIDFETHGDWREHNVLLRVNFPVDINAVRAAYEIQFGNVERETTSNHSWDTAKFEACGHKWADLSENGAGISLLNDCKYGYGIKDGNLSLTLIKAGTYPNSEADIGSHDFTYSIYPHSGRWQEAKTVEMAYNLNVPLLAVLQGENLGQDVELPKSFLSCSRDNCFVEVIKQAEDGNGLIVRMYENKNSQCKAELTVGIPVKQVYSCNLMEENEEELAVDGGRFQCVFKPYEIKTFRLI